MTVIVRLLLLFMVALGGQSLAFCQVDTGIYQYDGFLNVSDKQNAPSKLLYSGYDAPKNFLGTPDLAVREKFFFAFVDGYFVAKSVIKENRAKKIFGDREGHLLDTPQNRTLLQDIANDVKTTLGPDKHGNVWSAKNLEDGTQVWTQTRNGEIINGGLNKTPRVYNPETGLSAPTRPNWK